MRRMRENLEAARAATDAIFGPGAMAGVVLLGEDGHLDIRLFPSGPATAPGLRVSTPSLGASPATHVEERFVILSFPQGEGEPTVYVDDEAVPGTVEWPEDWPRKGRLGAIAVVGGDTLVCLRRACITCRGRGLHPLAVNGKTGSVCPACRGVPLETSASTPIRV